MESSIVKTIQLFETFNVRFGVMIVGFTMCGKTKLYQMLAKALTKLRVTNIPRLSPADRIPAVESFWIKEIFAIHLQSEILGI